MTPRIKNFIIYAAVGVWLYPVSILGADVTRFERDVISEARTKVQGVLQKYCAEACELINIDADASQSSGESEDLGFENVTGPSDNSVKINRMVVDVQVDDRVGTADQDRLGKLIVNALRGLGAAPSVRWSNVAFPQIGVSAEVEDRLKQSLQQRIQASVQQIIDAYCPGECVLASVTVDGKLASPDEVRGVADRELVRERGGRGILRLQNVDIDLSVDDKVPDDTRSKIMNLIRAKTRFVSPVNVTLVPVDFPETSANTAQKDPWGLDRLRQTLQIFRDLAGTKEIITSTTQNTSSTNSTSSNNKESTTAERVEAKESKESTNLTSKEKMSSSEKALNSALAETTSSSDKSVGIENQTLLYVFGGLIILLIAAGFYLKFASASRDARAMMDSMPGAHSARVPGLGGNDGPYSVAANPVINASGSGVSREALSVKMRIEGIREELLKAFVDNPKVARDTFSRMLREEGIDQTARYVHLFGPMIIFDLINDPSLQRDLNDLSEFYHKATFVFNDDQTLDLLNALKIKVTASEIRVLSRKRSEQFDFLQNLDAAQIFNLISDEKPHIQSIVLTQLDNLRRRNVFEIYTGESRVSLMRELCKSDAIPKEYLANVAKALHKKALSRTEFDTEQLRSSDIIIELLEKSRLVDQRRLMSDLVKTNPDAARFIKLKLVTVEMLPYIRDGHLLEIVMGLERQELLAFLVGSPEHIRDLLLTKAPSELAQTWLEDIEQSAGMEESRYRIAELRILGRIRNLANNGAIRLVDINDRIFSAESLAEVRRNDQELQMAVGPNSFAA